MNIQSFEWDKSAYLTIVMYHGYILLPGHFLLYEIFSLAWLEGVLYSRPANEDWFRSTGGCFFNIKIRVTRLFGHGQFSHRTIHSRTIHPRTIRQIDSSPINIHFSWNYTNIWINGQKNTIPYVRIISIMKMG